MNADFYLPPGKYFVSHSYCDRVLRDGYTRPNRCSEVFGLDGNQIPITEAINPSLDPVAILNGQIPDGVQLFIFPPIEVPPEIYVSNPLIIELTRCDGVIVFQDGKSAASFWVAFERDYALRIGKPVYGYHHTTRQLEKLALDENAPFHLPISIHSMSDKPAEFHEIVDFMKNERYFAPSADISSNQLAREHIQAGGYVIFIVSAKYMRYLQGQVGSTYRADRIILGLLEDCPLPNWAKPELVVRLYDENRAGLSRNRIDDLVVRLYKLISENQRRTWNDVSSL